MSIILSNLQSLLFQPLYELVDTLQLLRNINRLRAMGRTLVATDAVVGLP